MLETKPSLLNATSSIKSSAPNDSKNIINASLSFSLLCFVVVGWDDDGDEDGWSDDDGVGDGWSDGFVDGWSDDDGDEDSHPLPKVCIAK